VKSSKWKNVFIIHKQDMVGVSVDMVAMSGALACFVGDLMPLGDTPHFWRAGIKTT
jgi:hypothetical protein